MTENRITVSITAVDNITAILEDIQDSLEQLHIPPELIESMQTVAEVAIELEDRFSSVSGEFLVLRDLSIAATFLGLEQVLLLF